MKAVVFSQLCLLLMLGCLGSVGSAGDSPSTGGAASGGDGKIGGGSTNGGGTSGGGTSGGVGMSGGRGGGPGPKDAAGPGPTSGRMITRAEYVNTLIDLVRYDLGSAVADLPEDSASTTTGFLASIDGLLPSGPRTSSYERVAEGVAAAVPWAGSLDRFAICTDATDVCRRGFIYKLATVFFRKPLTAADSDRLLALFKVVDPAAAQLFQTGARLVLQAVLQSSHFLFILERGDNLDPVSKKPVVSPYEMVTRLSFLLWKSGPDDSLIAAASSGALKMPAGVSDLVQRMLADPRATRGVRGYADEWLKLYQSARRSTNPKRGITESFLRDSREETLRLVARVALSADFMSLFTDKKTELTPELAAIYGLPKKTGTAFAEYDVSAALMRQGLLTQSAFLGVRADIDHASIVDRGLTILHNLVCRQASLPPGVDNQFATTVAPNLPEREKFAIHETAPTCRACHQAFDPFGHAFERFDVAGRLISKDDNGNVLRSDGEALLDGKSSPFKDAVEFSNLMAKSPEVEACLARKMYLYVFNRPIGLSDVDAEGRLAQSFSSAGRSYAALVRSVVSSTGFNSVSPQD